MEKEVEGYVKGEDERRGRGDGGRRSVKKGRRGRGGRAAGG